jgi:hypothetical protein
MSQKHITMKLKVIMVIHNCNRCDENKDDPCLARPASARPLIFYYRLLLKSCTGEGLCSLVPNFWGYKGIIQPVLGHFQEYPNVRLHVYRPTAELSHSN